MASSGGVGGHPLAAGQAAVAPVDLDPDEDESEWEYEYSTTENEVSNAPGFLVCTTAS